MTLQGHRSLWTNFYHLTLSKSVVKLDFVMNCQFWSSLIFIVYNNYINEKNDEKDSMWMF